jgi:phage baseplate assembly protein V
VRNYGSLEKADATSFNIVRSGTVVNRRMGKNGPQVQVTYEDRGVVSDWLPVGNQGSAGTTMFWCPRLNDNVTVLHYPTAIEQGIIVCTSPTGNGGAIQPDSLNSIAMRSDDGAQFSYNPDAKTLAIQGVTTVHITAAGDITIQANGNLTAHIGSQAVWNVPEFVINGNLLVNGNISTNGGEGGDGSIGITGGLNVAKPVYFAEGGTAKPHLINDDNSGGGT